MAHRKVGADRLEVHGRTLGGDEFVTPIEVWGDHYFLPGKEAIYSNRVVFVRVGNLTAYTYVAMSADEAETFAGALLAAAVAVRNDPAQEELELSPTELWKEHRGDAA